VRFCYLDTAGTSKPAENPFVVCAGVIVDADVQWKALERYLSDMADEYVPPSKRLGFYFHAKDLFHGSGKIFGRDIYPRDRALQALKELCEIPHKFDLPVVMGSVERTYLAEHHSTLKPCDLLFMAQAMAYQQCAIAVEKYMRQECPSEVATLVHENDNDTKALIKSLHNYMKTEESGRIWADDKMIAGLLPFQNIVDTAHFAEKTDTSLLQVADACALAINRKIMNKPKCEILFDPIDWYLVIRHKSFGPRGPEPAERVQWARPVPASLVEHALLTWRFALKRAQTSLAQWIHRLLSLWRFR